MKYDVIIVGSGIAGLSCALTLAQQGKKVALVTKKHLMSSATNYAQGGVAAVLSNIDTVEKHVEDTCNAGSFHNKKSAVTKMAKESKAAIEWLIRCGVPFATHDGELQLTREGGHSLRRIAFVGDYTGKAIEEALVKRSKKEKNITVWTDTSAVSLIVTQNKCTGIEIAEKGKKKTTILSAEAVVLATGGVGQLFEHTTNPRISTGDGIALAARAHAKLSDMEFIQFHPTAFMYKGKTPFLLSETLRGEGGILKNALGQAFMEHYDSRKDLAPRDIVARAIFEEEKKGTVHLDLRHLDRTKVYARFPSLSAAVKKYGFDLALDLIPISPAAHYLCGGIEVDLQGKTTVKGLYAFGEVSCTGVHGANRLASNSLLEAVVFARTITKTLASINITSTSNNKATQRTHAIKQPTVKEKKIFTRIQRELKKTMWNNVGVVRTKESLMHAKRYITELHNELTQTTAHKNIVLLRNETENMLDVAMFIIDAALARKKSLGCHFRTS